MRIGAPTDTVFGPKGRSGRPSIDLTSTPDRPHIDRVSTPRLHFLDMPSTSHRPFIDRKLDDFRLAARPMNLQLIDLV